MRVRSVFCSMLPGLAAVIFCIGASAQPAQAGNPFSGPVAGAAGAYASASIQYAVTSQGWSLADAQVSDDGGNYNYAGFDPISVNCSVFYNGTVKSREGTISVIQKFVWTGDPANPGTLNYSSTVAASARFDAFGQTAHAKSHTQSGNAFVTVVNEVEATGTVANTPDGEAKSHTSTYSNSGIGTSWTETATLEADVSTP